MSGFVHAGSPLAPLLTHLAVPHAAQFGALIALCELWVGLSALLGLLTRLGALGGLAISFTFYLTATWTVRPYFLGADLPYALGWLTLALAGPGIYSLDEYFFGRLRRARAATVQAPPRKGRSAPAPVPLTQDPVARSAFMRALGTGATVVAGGGIAGGVAKLLTPSKVFAHPGSAAWHGAEPGDGGWDTRCGNRRGSRPASAGWYDVPGQRQGAAREQRRPIYRPHIGRRCSAGPPARRTLRGLRRRLHARWLHRRVRPHAASVGLSLLWRGVRSGARGAGAGRSCSTTAGRAGGTVRIDTRGNAFAKAGGGGSPAPTRPADGNG